MTKAYLCCPDNSDHIIYAEELKKLLNIDTGSSLNNIDAVFVTGSSVTDKMMGDIRQAQKNYLPVFVFSSVVYDNLKMAGGIYPTLMKSPIFHKLSMDFKCINPEV